MSDQDTAACCPKCGAGLQVQQADTVLVASCPSCQGIWLSADALQMILTKRGSREAAAVVPFLDQGFEHPSDRCCVGCHQPMLMRRIMTVELDYCRQCRGIFLDAGELHEVSVGEYSLDGQTEKFASDSDRAARAIWDLLSYRRGSIFDIFD